MVILIFLFLLAVLLLLMIASLYKTFLHFLKLHDIKPWRSFVIFLEHTISNLKSPRKTYVPSKPVSSNEILLITACINAGNTPFVAVRDQQKRLSQYLAALSLWITKADIDKIVFCENTAFALDREPLLSLAREKGKTLEFLSFDGNRSSSAKGKGWGEGEIIEYALGNSRLITKEDVFYKITGRLFIDNFNDIRKAHAGAPVVFNKLSCELNENGAETRFFKCSVNFYREHLMNAYKDVDDPKGRYMEHVLYSRLKGLNVPSFRIFPDFAGISGSSGKEYKITAADLAWKSFLSRLGLFGI